MDQRAMLFLNLLGNKFFALLPSWLLSQPLKDSLCGSKVLWRSDYEGLPRVVPILATLIISATSTRSLVLPS
jgi:hypothetical protein